MSYPVFFRAFCRRCNQETQHYQDISETGLIIFCLGCVRVVGRGGVVKAEAAK